MAKKKPQLQPLLIAIDHPLAEEHRVVAEWIEAAVSSQNAPDHFEEVALQSVPSGMRILDAGPEQARRFLSAAVAQAKHWEQTAQQIQQQSPKGVDWYRVQEIPGWKETWARRRYAVLVAEALLRRHLPLDKQDILQVVNWALGVEPFTTFYVPLSFIVRALERFARQSPLDSESLEPIQKFAAELRRSQQKQAPRLAAAVEQLCAAHEVLSDRAEPERTQRMFPQPAPAGHPRVLVQLKQALGVASEPDASKPTVVIGPDRFPMLDDSPLRGDHATISRMLDEALADASHNRSWYDRFVSAVGKQELASVESFMLAAAERRVHFSLARPADNSPEVPWQIRAAACSLIDAIPHVGLDPTREGVFDLLVYFASCRDPSLFDNPAVEVLITRAERFAQDNSLTEGERFVLSLFRASLVLAPVFGILPPTVKRLTRLIGDGFSFCLEPGEVWTDAVNQEFTAMNSEERAAWANFFTHMFSANSARPSKKWLSTARQLTESIGGDQVKARLARWLPLVAGGRSTLRLGTLYGNSLGAATAMTDDNATCLRGLLWLVPSLPGADDLIRQVAAVALTAYRKIPGVGPRAVKAGNAAVYALSQGASEEAVGQLAMLKVRVKFGSAQKEIEKAFNVAAEALGMSRDDIEEMGVPSYGLEAGGRLEELLGDYRAELRVTGSDAQLTWFDAKGKLLKSVPAKIRQGHKDTLAELQQSLKDVRGMLPAQRDRLDALFLRPKSWSITQWRERYLQHPLIGTIASRLIWCVDGTPALFTDGAATDVDGQPIEHGKLAEISLWHPVGRPIQEITAWRRTLETLNITQPFKQAHREVYLLTDAERNTATYSNRFAAHIVRQHQFNALCAARRWKNRLRLLVDDSYPPACRELPHWGLRAEFWIEGVGDDYGVDTNESGVYLRLATDQVRFYRIDAAQSFAHAGGGGYVVQAAGPGRGNVNEPLTLDQIPPLVFSEIMRDVDLFVGVASVGNDPTWQDGGPAGRYLDYWQRYSFGDLSGTATTRKEVLQRLVPRLKIARQCSFNDRFLIVQGQKRTYKIHLGSGNILMEPNDQYLCIVPDARSRSPQDELFLPFEGDNTLSIIISKAFLLADDAHIKDPTIKRQIDSK